MSGERFDYRNERQRHEKFVGREALLARLDALLVDDSADRWVVITGGPGMARAPSCRRGSRGARRPAPWCRVRGGAGRPARGLSIKGQQHHGRAHGLVATSMIFRRITSAPLTTARTAKG